MIPAKTPAITAATNAARMTTSHCARFTTGDCICVNGVANAGTPAVNEGINVANENHFVGRSVDEAEDVSLSGGDVRRLHLYCARPNKWPTDDGNAGADEC